MKRVAAIDIGTNTTRLLVADVTRAAGDRRAQVDWLRRRSIVTRLGEGVDARGVFADHAIERTVAVLARYADDIAELGCVAVRAVATSATRDASNRDEFLDQAASALGVRPDVIRGEEEARFAFRGATGGGVGAPPHLVIDPGGGSTEFVFGHDEPETIASVDIGSVRLTERLLPDKPATAAQLGAARRHVDQLLVAQVPALQPETVIGVGSTYTALAALALGLTEYDSDAVHARVLALSDIHELADELATMTLADLEALPSLDPARAPVVVGGAVVAERALGQVGAQAIVVSERDLLDGIALDLA